MVENTEVPKDIKKRVDDCNIELQGLLKKYRLVLGGQAYLTPDGRVASRPILIPEEQLQKAEPEVPSKGKEKSKLTEA